VRETAGEEVGEAVPKRATFSPVFRALQNPCAGGPGRVRRTIAAPVVHDENLPDVREKAPDDAAHGARTAIGGDESGREERLAALGTGDETGA
jgi:hypothetical protein